MNKKIYALATVLMFVSAFALGYSFHNGLFHRDPQLQANVYVIHESVSGTEVIPVGNVITNLAENAVRDSLGFGNSTLYTNKTDYISLGNATVAQTLTKVTDECDNASNFARKQGTVSAWYNGTDYAYNVTATWTANATVTINTTGLNWFSTDQSDNNLFAVAAITETAFASSDNCTITWVITIDAN